MSHPVVRARLAHGHRRTSTWSIAAALLASLLLGVAPVLAAPQTRSTTLTYSGSTNPALTSSVTGTCDDCVPDFFAQVFTGDPGSFAFGAAATSTVNHLDWTNTAGVDVHYDDSVPAPGPDPRPVRRPDTRDWAHPRHGQRSAGSYGLYNDPSGGVDFVPYGGQSGHLEGRDLGLHLHDPAAGREPRACSSGSQSFAIASFTIFVVPFLDPISINIDFSVAVSLDLTSAATASPPCARSRSPAGPVRRPRR